MSTDTPVALTDYAAYLLERKALLTARQGFFEALRAYLRPEQRPYARQLGDRLWNSTARQIAEHEWVANVPRGFVTILPNIDAGRGFRLMVLQQGNILRIGVRLPSRAPADVTTALCATYHGADPVLHALSNEEQLISWEFDARALYKSAQEMETAIYLVSALFEKALQLTVPTSKE